MYKKILVPVDGSDNSRLALKHAVKLAEIANADLTVLHVMYLPSQMEKYAKKMATSMQEWAEEHAAEIFNSFKDDYAGYAKVREKVTWGESVHKIAEEAHDGEYDLIVIGSRGMGGVKTLVMGSVSRGVVNSCKCPVLIIR